VPEGSFLISVRAPVGALNIANTECGIGRGLCAFIPAPCELKQSFSWWLLSHYKDRLLAEQTGSTYGAVSAHEVGDLAVSYPGVSEQRAIADFLDRETARIDELIAKKERLIGLVQERHLSLMDALLVSAPFKREKWPVLARFIVSKCDGPFGSDMKSEHYADCGVRLIRLQNIRRGYFDDSDEAFISAEHFRALPGHDARPGDLLVAGLGDPNNPVGRACLLPAAVGIAMVKADCFRLRLDERRLLHSYAASYLNSTVARAEIGLQLRGATRERINLSGISGVRLPVLDLSSQGRIVERISRSWADAQRVVDAIKTNIPRLKDYRSSLISAAVTGQIDVRSYRQEPEVVMEAS